MNHVFGNSISTVIKSFNRSNGPYLRVEIDITKWSGHWLVVSWNSWSTSPGKTHIAHCPAIDFVRQWKRCSLLKGTPWRLSGYISVDKETPYFPFYSVVPWRLHWNVFDTLTWSWGHPGVAMETQEIPGYASVWMRCQGPNPALPRDRFLRFYLGHIESGP